MENLRIRELTESQITELKKDSKFRSFQPVSCSDCGNRREFKDCVFHISGLRDDDIDRGLLSFHMKEKYGIAGYITRNTGEKMYLQAAVCPDCGSTKIVFDLVMNFDSNSGKQGLDPHPRI